MNRLDENIENMAFLLDSLRTLRKIYETGDCNSCKIKLRCKFSPMPGQMVRYNCPFYVKDGDDNG